MNLSESQSETGELPEGWVLATIPEMIPRDGVFIDGDWVESKDQDPDGDMRLIQLADVGDGVYRNKSSRFLTRKKATKLGCTFLKRGDVLIARMPDPLGRACIFPGDLKEAVTAVDVCIIRTGELGVDNRWLMFATNSPAIRRAIESLQAGTTRKRISRKNLATICFPIPPANEQKRIVAKIEELFTRLDKGVEALEKIKKELKRYRQSVLKSAFEGRLTEQWRKENKDRLEPASKLLERISKERTCLPKGAGKGKAKKLPPLDKSGLSELPEGWEWARVAEIGEAVTGTTPSKKKTEYYGSDFPFYKPTDLNEGYYVKSSADGLSKMGLEQARLLPEKSVLVTCIGATIGKTGFIRTAGASNQQINAIIPENGLSPEYIYFCCISTNFQKTILDNASATTLPILNKGKFEFLALPVPPYEEQQQIVAEIDRHFSIADEVEQTIEKSLKESGRLRQSILKKAFEGKLVPQDPNDEPAEKLLERIKAEKAKLQAEQKAKKKKARRK
jgi:type I restriction enzyme S subunit